jgi:hypothetical protein
MPSRQSHHLPQVNTCRSMVNASSAAGQHLPFDGQRIICRRGSTCRSMLNVIVCRRVSTCRSMLNVQPSVGSARALDGQRFRHPWRTDTCVLRERLGSPPGWWVLKRGVAAGRSAQRGTSGAATGGGGPQAPPTRMRQIPATHWDRFFPTRMRHIRAHPSPLPTRIRQVPATIPSSSDP